MNWKLVVPLGLTGVVPPLAGHLLSLDPAVAFPVSLALWTVLAAALWVPLALREGGNVFATLVAVGAVAGVAAGAIDVAYTGDPMLLVVAIMVGLVWGALFGAVAVGIRRWRGTQATAA